MIVGVEMPNGNKYHPRFLVVLVISIIAETMHQVGIYENWPNLKKLCFPLIIYSLIIQQMARLINRNLLNDEKKIRNLQVVVLNFFKEEELDPENIPILKNGARKTRLFLYAYLTVSFIVYHTPLVTSLVISYVSGRYATFAEFRLPFTTLDNAVGFTINTLLTALITEMVYILSMLSDMIFIYHTYQTLPMSDIFVRKLKLLGIKLVDYKMTIDKQFDLPATSNQKCLKQRLADYQSMYAIMKKNIKDIEDELEDIIIRHEAYNNYIKMMIDSYQYTAFTALSLNSIAIGLALITLRFVSIPIGIAATTILLFQVLLPCVNGSFIQQQNEKVVFAVFNFPWYELSVSKRKIYLQFFLVCQKTKILTLPIIGNVDMGLFTHFVNASYSYFMAVWKIVKN